MKEGFHHEWVNDFKLDIRNAYSKDHLYHSTLGVPPNNSHVLSHSQY